MIEGILPHAETSTPTTPAGAQKTLGKEEFLRLLVAQLSAQDPLNPMDSREFSAELAQFSALEQMTNVNKTLEDLVKAQQAMGNSSMISLIGKKVDVPGNRFNYAAGGTENLTYSLDAEAASAQIEIYNSAGTLVKTLSGPGAEGSNLTVWNGTDNQGKPVNSGVFTFKVIATDGKGKSVNSQTFTTGLVTDVLFE
nr:flagellar hook assembly protein FlgD [Nitrospinaceae bacterium]NIR53460.1 flagellar hook assembly protein FlgD [Nitrospinaceae bacterium]NIS83863.1 flagellar hook assembly protein FlgD [Nitrospinaceae bacterium]NIT80656.1 flagellar hook assembly protein FlgD [Nitrospinaceae bacterium]NIU42982.1 flagellar hook assembly protein FlgD [Nitrospinaceae bacterium]